MWRNNYSLQSEDKETAKISDLRIWNQGFESKNNQAQLIIWMRCGCRNISKLESKGDMELPEKAKKLEVKQQPVKLRQFQWRKKSWQLVNCPFYVVVNTWVKK